MARERMPIGVFTSVGAGLGASVDSVLALGVRTVQIHTPLPQDRHRDRALEIERIFSEAGVAITLVFCGFPGESYENMAIVKETIGLVPRATRADRLRQTKEIADFASLVESPGIGIHVGFISEDWSSPEFAEIVDVLGEVADHCAGRGLTVNLETGQETADTLLHVLESVGRDNLAVNFDPANMIMYGSGEPLEALAKVGPYVRSVHCKDAVWSDRPGVEYGAETPLGEGQVNMEKFIAMLKDMSYTGPLTIEREISGERQITDIQAGIEYLKGVKARLGIV